MKILIIEDSNAVRKIFTKILTEYLDGKFPHDIRSCDGAKEFRKLIDSGFVPEVVLSDWMLGSETAFPLLDELVGLFGINPKKIALITGFLIDKECHPSDRQCFSIKSLIKKHEGISVFEKPINTQQLIDIFVSLERS